MQQLAYLAFSVLLRLRKMVKEKGISKVWLTNKISATLIIPIGIARRHRLNDSCHVTVEETNDGILVRKLDI